MNITLWVIQIALAFVFFMAGVQKIAPAKKTNDTTEQAGNTSQNKLFLFIGTMEILGAVGLILPWWLQIVPILTPLAAIGFVLIMIFAAVFHTKRKEYKSIVTNMILLALALFVAIGRLL